MYNVFCVNKNILWINIQFKILKVIKFSLCYLSTSMNILSTFSIGCDIGQLVVIDGLDLNEFHHFEF